MSKIRVLLADDHPLILEGVRNALANAEDMEVVGEASTGNEVLPLVRRCSPDVLLLDLRLPGIDGLACLELLAERHPALKVLVMSALVDREHIEAALTRGACSYIAKSINPLDLPSAVRQAVEGSVYNVLGVAEGDPMAQARGAGLTEREATILVGVARGLSNRAIARECWVTEQTVKFHLTNIYRKLDVKNRVEAASAAYRLGIGRSPTLDDLPSTATARRH